MHIHNGAPKNHHTYRNHLPKFMKKTNPIPLAFMSDPIHLLLLQVYLFTLFIFIFFRIFLSVKKLFVKLVFHSLFQNLVRGIVNALQRQVNVIIFKFVQSFLLSTHFIISLLYMVSFVLLYILSRRSKVGFEGSLFKDTCKMRFNL